MVPRLRSESPRLSDVDAPIAREKIASAASQAFVPEPACGEPAAASRLLGSTPNRRGEVIVATERLGKQRKQLSGHVDIVKRNHLHR